MASWRETGNYVARDPNKVNKALRDILSTAAERFSAATNGRYSIEAFSGYAAKGQDRRSNSSRHRPGKTGTANAIDVNIIDNTTGQPIGGLKGNYQNKETYRTYEQFAQIGKEVQMEQAPELKDSFRWGGYFSGKVGKKGIYGAVDLMHFDLKPGAPMGGGTWEDGLTKQQRAYMPGVVSVGMGEIANIGRPKANVPNVPPSLTAFKPPSVPALAYMPTREAVAPTQSQAYAPSFARGVPAALGAIEGIAPSRPTQSLVGRPVDMSRFAPQAPAAPVGPMADASYMNGGVLGAPNSDVPASFAKAAPDANYSFAMAKSVMPGGIMSPTGPLGGNGLYAKAQDPATFAGAPMGISTPSMMANAPTALGAVPAGIGSMPSLPMSMAPPGIGALPQTNVAPMAPPAAPPAPPMAPPPAPPKALNPVYQAQDAYPAAPAAPPSFTPSDIYGGQIGSAQASGGNTVSRDEHGITSVTNKYGVTTGMTPTGKQTAYGPGFGPIGNLFGGMNGMSSKNKGMMAGAVLGALAGGIPGAVAGGLLGRAVTGGRNSYPAAPSKANDRQGVPGGARTAAERSSISPAASRSISSGKGVSGLW